MGNSENLDRGTQKFFPKTGIYERDFNEQDKLITFSEATKKVCVGVVDIVGSTRISARLNNGNLAKYYGMFLNTLGSVITRFEGKVVKNIGDSILYYFDEGSTQSQFIRCLECNLSMIQIHDYLNMKLRNMGLPKLDYRISADYGPVSVAKNPFMIEDIFGQPVNVCSKINNMAQPNGFVVGSDFYTAVKKLECYRFKEVRSFSSGLRCTYPVYSVNYDDSKIRLIIGSCIEKTLLELGTPDYEQIVARLFERHHCFLSDCYKNPSYLTSVLEELYGNASKAIAKNIEKRIEELSLPKPVKEFLIYLKD